MIITKNTRNVAATILVVGLAMFGLYTVAEANPSFFPVGAASASATTTLTYMTPGTATTTVAQPVYSTANNNAVDSAAFEFQFTGSSTASNINLAFEYADLTAGVDCSVTQAACDWYKDTLLSSISTTTNNANLNTPTNYALAFASTTVGGSIGTSTRTTRVVTVPTPAPYIRVVITMPVGSFNGAVWGRFIPRKEQK